MKFLIPFTLLLAACDGGGGSPTPAPPAPSPAALTIQGVTYPPTLYYTPQPTYTVAMVVHNTGGMNSAATGAVLTMDGIQAAVHIVPTLAPGEEVTIEFPIWNNQMENAGYSGPPTVDHAFKVSVDGVEVLFTITFVVAVSPV